MLEEALQRLCTAIAAGGPGARGDLDVVVAALSRISRGAAPGLPREELVDVVSAALETLVSSVSDGSLARDRPVSPWLAVVTRRKAYDALRRGTREAPNEHVTMRAPAGHDGSDAIEQLINRIVAHDRVADVMRAIASAGDHALNDTLRVWCHLAALGEAPSYRAVAAALGISHTAVRKRLQTLPRYVQPRAGEDPPAAP